MFPVPRGWIVIFFEDPWAQPLGEKYKKKILSVHNAFSKLPEKRMNLSHILQSWFMLPSGSTIIVLLELDTGLKHGADYKYTENRFSIFLWSTAHAH